MLRLRADPLVMRRTAGAAPPTSVAPRRAMRLCTSGCACRARDMLGHASLAAAAASGQVAPAASDGLQHFKDGFLRYKATVLAANPAKSRALAAAQSPKIMVIGCCDSRVDPAMLMDADPGDLFVVRNVANLVPPFERRGIHHGTSAALEFAVTGLKVQHIIVLGHMRCGGIAALMRRTMSPGRETTSDFIDAWMEIGAPAGEHTRLTAGHLSFEEQCSCCERESVNVSLGNLLTFPFVKAAVSAGDLALHGWYYNLEDAHLETWSVSYQKSPVTLIT